VVILLDFLYHEVGIGQVRELLPIGVAVEPRQAIPQAEGEGDYPTYQADEPQAAAQIMIHERTRQKFRRARATRKVSPTVAGKNTSYLKEAGLVRTAGKCSNGPVRRTFLTCLFSSGATLLLAH
jgi:hypothetical protein